MKDLSGLYANLDLGKGHIRLVVIQYDRDLFTPIFAAEEPSQNIIQHGYITDHEAASKIINSLLTEANRVLHLKLTKVFLILPANGLTIQMIDKTIPIQKTVSVYDVNHLYSLSHQLATTPKTQLVTLLPFAYQLDQQNFSQAIPNGQKTKSLTLRSYAYLISKELFNNYLALFSYLNVQLLDFILSPFATSYEAIPAKKLNEPTIVVDYAQTNVRVALLEKAVITNYHEIKMGAANINADIAYLVKEPKADLEQIKLKFAHLNDIRPEWGQIIIADNVQQGKLAFSKPVPFSVLDMQKIIIARVTDLCKAISNVIQQFPKNANVPIVFTGGGSKIAGFRAFVENYFSGRKITVYQNQYPGFSRDYCTAIGAAKMAVSQNRALNTNLISVKYNLLFRFIHFSMVRKALYYKQQILIKQTNQPVAALLTRDLSSSETTPAASANIQADVITPFSYQKANHSKNSYSMKNIKNK